MVAFTLNGKPVSVEADSSTPLLWVIRDQLKLTGTKYGCGMPFTPARVIETLKA
jgi:aerobic-type carbon monoxide dehydrogenase small subunit (CoxS/CutS family)